MISPSVAPSSANSDSFSVIVTMTEPDSFVGTSLSGFSKITPSELVK